MATYYFEARNTDNNVQIRDDGNYRFFLNKKLVTAEFTLVDSTVRLYRRKYNASEILVFRNTSTTAVTFCTAISYDGYLYVQFSAAPTNIYVYIFTTIDKFSLSAGGVGLRIFNAKSDIIFDSSLHVLRPVSFGRIDSPEAGTTISYGENYGVMLLGGNAGNLYYTDSRYVWLPGMYDSGTEHPSIGTPFIWDTTTEEGFFTYHSGSIQYTSYNYKTATRYNNRYTMYTAAAKDYVGLKIAKASLSTASFTVAASGSAQAVGECSGSTDSWQSMTQIENHTEYYYHEMWKPNGPSNPQYPIVTEVPPYEWGNIMYSFTDKGMYGLENVGSWGFMQYMVVDLSRVL